MRSKLMARTKIPKKIEHLVKDECLHACANPKCRQWISSAHEIHHIDGDPGNNALENLILLCSSCHSQTTRGIHSEADICFWKRMAQMEVLSTPAELQKGTTTIHNQGGIAGHSVHVETAIFKPSKTSAKTPTLPGTIGADPSMRTYADYLVKRYIDWRKKGSRIDRRQFDPGSAHGILGKGFGSPSTVMHISQTRFFEWVAQAQEKINKTVWGKNSKNRNYHTYEEHLKERNG